MHYVIKQAEAPVASSSARRGTRGAAAKQRQQEQEPDSSETVSFVTQVRDYSREQEDLVAALIHAAGGQDLQAQPQQGLAAAAATEGAAGEGQVKRGPSDSSAEGKPHPSNGVAESGNLEVSAEGSPAQGAGQPGDRPAKRPKAEVAAAAL